MVSKKSVGKVTFIKLFGLKRGDRVKTAGYSSGNCGFPHTYGNVVSINPDGRVLWITDRQSFVEWVGVDKLIPVFTMRENWKGQCIDWEKTRKLPLSPDIKGLTRYAGLSKAVKEGWIKLKKPMPYWYRGY